MLDVPWASPKSVRLCGKRANWANLHRVAREIRAKRLIWERHNLRIVSATRKRNQCIASNFVGKARATIAQDTTLAIEIHIVTNGDWLFVVSLLFNKAALAWAMTKCLVLQRALAALVAYWTIERMVSEQQLEHTLLGFFNALGFGINNLAFCNWSHTRHHHHWAAWTDNFNETLAAHAHWFHAWVITKARNEIVCAVGSRNDHLAFARSNNFAVDGDADCVWIYDWLWRRGI
jgi:hypothetical protein